MPAALLAATLVVSGMFSLSCARVQNARAVGRTRRARACQVLHGTSSAGKRLSPWTRAIGAKGACSANVLEFGERPHFPSSLALACHQCACLVPALRCESCRVWTAAMRQFLRERALVQDEETNTSVESASSSPSMFTCLLPPVLGSDEP